MKDRLLLAFYGDDFTGSTDAMEALHQYGLRTILFFEPPHLDDVEKFGSVDCIGVAGTARAMNNEEMTNELVPIYKAFNTLNPKFVHYKVCSTFDSAQKIGSIGLAADIGKDILKQNSVPFLIGAPVLGRYTIFGNHFAKFKNDVYRLDMHPVMSKHPVTPMHEADLGKHLAQQTKEHIDYFTAEDIEQNINNFELENNAYVIYDALNEKHMKYFGDLLFHNVRKDTPLFTVGSSGVEYAIGDKVNSLQDKTVLTNRESITANVANNIFVVSGSVSAVTHDQLIEAEEAGFASIQVPYEYLGKKDLPENFLNSIIQEIKNDTKVILYTARGADDPTIEYTKSHLKNEGIEEDFGNYIGKQLGLWTKYIMDHVSIDRLVIAGGDTSGFVTSQLGIFAMEVIESIAPGAPLCRSYSEMERFNNLEIALKSGQLGGENYYQNVFKAGLNT
jgi:uncharacterized protein YgbK (DUF1537 family)